MSEKVEQVLQKISFIERDIDLHKNILASIPKGREEEMEQIIHRIVQMKERVNELKGSISEIDPAVHAHIMKLENATGKFQELAATKTFLHVFTLDQGGECTLDLVDGTRIDCLVKAQAAGSWTIMTLDGEVLEYSVEEVME